MLSYGYTNIPPNASSSAQNQIHWCDMSSSYVARSHLFIVITLTYFLYVAISYWAFTFLAVLSKISKFENENTILTRVSFLNRRIDSSQIQRPRLTRRLQLAKILWPSSFFHLLLLGIEYIAINLLKSLLCVQIQAYSRRSYSESDQSFKVFGCFTLRLFL